MIVKSVPLCRIHDPACEVFVDRLGETVEPVRFGGRHSRVVHQVEPPLLGEQLDRLDVAGRQVRRLEQMENRPPRSDDGQAHPGPGRPLLFQGCDQERRDARGDPGRGEEVVADRKPPFRFQMRDVFPYRIDRQAVVLTQTVEGRRGSALGLELGEMDDVEALFRSAKSVPRLAGKRSDAGVEQDSPGRLSKRVRQKAGDEGV